MYTEKKFSEPFKIQVCSEFSFKHHKRLLNTYIQSKYVKTQKSNVQTLFILSTKFFVYLI